MFFFLQNKKILLWLDQHNGLIFFSELDSLWRMSIKNINLVSSINIYEIVVFRLNDFFVCAWLSLPTLESQLIVKAKSLRVWTFISITLQAHDQNHRQMKQSELHGLHARLKNQRVLEGLLKVLPCTNRRTLQAQSGWQATQKRRLYPCWIANEKLIQIRLRVAQDCKQNQGRWETFAVLRSNNQLRNQWRYSSTARGGNLKSSNHYLTWSCGRK